MISILSDETINQIAAGEVIESPASVVKELVENSLDAGAKKITIEINGGGLKLVKITDDGSGMPKEDVPLSIVRHATSKISKATDLFKIVSKGFRGEALASIASISKMHVFTALEGEVGTHIEVEKGEILKKKAVARTKGTTIEVHSLFFNVPARKKFQKSAAAISAEVFRMVTVMALSHPEVQFELISNGKTHIKTRAKGLQERAKELLGEDFIRGSFRVDFEEGSLKFEGFIGSPTNTRANKMGQYLFLNKRAVSCAVIEKAVSEGYGTRLDEKRYPTFLLHLSSSPDLVDVNVHPQKLQVRLRKEELFREKVALAVNEALKAEVKERKPVYFNETKLDFEEVNWSFKEEPKEIQNELEINYEPFEVLGVLSHYFLIKEPDFEGVIFIDLKAAQFRVVYEELTKNVRTSSQQLLIPFNIDLTPVESAMILTHQAAIEEIGFSLKPIGKEVFMVEAIPPFINEIEVKPLIAEMANQLQEFIGKSDYEKLRRQKLSQVAARFAKTRGQYSLEEAKELVKKLKNSKSPLQDPKGNPTKFRLSNDEIENFFTSKKS